MKTRFLLSALAAAAIVIAPACTKQTGTQVQTDLAPAEACVVNAVTDALITGVTDPVAIVTSYAATCAALTLQSLANVVRGLLSAPNPTPDGGVGFSYVRTNRLLTIQKNLLTMGVSPQ